MLKKIAVSQLRLGMHLHKLEGAWIHHPFWKTRFVIDSPEDLLQLQGCGVTECWIDAGKGLDVAAAPLPAVAKAADPPQTATAPPAPPDPPAAPRVSMEAELKQAAAICNRGRQAVTAMFQEVRMGRTIDAEGCMPLVEDIATSVGATRAHSSAWRA